MSNKIIIPDHFWSSKINDQTPLGEYHSLLIGCIPSSRIKRQLLWIEFSWEKHFPHCLPQSYLKKFNLVTNNNKHPPYRDHTIDDSRLSLSYYGPTMKDYRIFIESLSHSILKKEEHIQHHMQKIKSHCPVQPIKEWAQSVESSSTFSHLPCSIGWEKSWTSWTSAEPSNYKFNR